MTTAFFTSDHHFYHANVIEFCHRPFSSLDDMHDHLITKWNSVVARGDIVYHLGDFALTNKKTEVAAIDKLLKSLNGSKHLIRGNHDRDAVTRSSGWSWVGDYKRIKVEKQAIVLSHYPMLSWHGMHRGSWMLHGHSHGTLDMNGQYGMHKRIDVGVDVHDYEPVSFHNIKIMMDCRTFVPVDGHI